jgi:WD40 repeat protein
MPSDLDRRAHRVFVRALDVDAPGRDGFLSVQCGGDDALERRVRDLLAAIDTSAGFLEAPALADRSSGTVHVRGYTITRVLGHGGMATVYEAQQEQPQRTVALKVMNRALANTSAIRRFRFETEVLARLKHPAIAQIYEAGTCDDAAGHALPFFAMELVGGARSITRYADEQGLSLHQRLAMVAEVCDAVQHGHQLGVIHRDLKPANILVDESGRPKIIDFGVARSANAERGLTQDLTPGQLVGTLNAMSPEQCLTPSSVDARTDVYSLGAVLYHLIAGRPPHDLALVSIPQAIRTIAEKTPARIGALVAEARGDLDAIVMTALERDVSRRYSSAGALAADIRRYLSHQTIDARPPSVVHQARLFARRNRVLVGGAGVLLGVLLAASTAIALLAYRATAEADRRRQAQVEALRERDQAQRQAYIAGVAGALAAAQMNDSAQSRRRLDLTPPGLRGWEWSFVNALIDRGEHTVRVTSRQVRALAAAPSFGLVATATETGEVALWNARTFEQVGVCAPVATSLNTIAMSPDSKTVMFAGEDGVVRVWQTDAAASVELARLPGPVDCIAFSAGGAVAIATRDGVAQLWTAGPHSADAQRVPIEQPGGVHAVAFSPGGHLLVTIGGEGAARLRDAVTLSVVHELDFAGRSFCTAFSRDGQLLAIGGELGTVKVWRTFDGTLAEVIDVSQSHSGVRAVSFSADGRRLAYGLIDRNIHVQRLDTKAPESRFVGHEEAVYGLAFDDATDQLISSSWDGTLRFWPVTPGSPGRSLRMIEAHDGQVRSVAYSPDGRLLASGGRDGLVQLFDTTFFEPLATLKGDDKSILAVAFSPTAPVLASADESGEVHFWSTHTGEQTASLPRQEQPVISLCYSPDGARLAAGLEEGEVRIADTATGAVLHAFPAHSTRINAVLFSPDGRMLASASRDGTVKLWNADGEPLRNLGAHGSDAFALAFSPDGKRLYSGSRDQTVAVWETLTGAELPRLLAAGQFVTSLAMSPDGRRLAAGSWFGELLFWDMAAPEPILTFRGYNSAIRALAFSPDAARLRRAGGHAARVPGRVLARAGACSPGRRGRTRHGAGGPGPPCGRGRHDRSAAHPGAGRPQVRQQRRTMGGPAHPRARSSSAARSGPLIGAAGCRGRAGEPESVFTDRRSR